MVGRPLVNLGDTFGHILAHLSDFYKALHEGKQCDWDHAMSLHHAEFWEGRSLWGYRLNGLLFPSEERPCWLSAINYTLNLMGLIAV